MAHWGIASPAACIVDPAACAAGALSGAMHQFTRVRGEHAPTRVVGCGCGWWLLLSITCGSIVFMAGARARACLGLGSAQAPRRMVLGRDDGFLPTVVEVGRGTYGVGNVALWHFSEPHLGLTIGSFTAISYGVTVMLDGGHELDHASSYRYDGGLSREKRG